MQLGLGRRQAVEGLGLAPGRRRLLGLPVAVGLVGQHTEGGQAAVGQRLAAHLARALVAQQQAQSPGRQCATTGAGEQAAEVAATGGACGLAGRLLLQKVLAGFEELVEQSTGIHESLQAVSRFQ
ncbi:hypothetical protein D3C84_904680 [compost metagenome]